ncbi:unnamed protein product [Laminaria digitata]
MYRVDSEYRELPVNYGFIPCTMRVPSAAGSCVSCSYRDDTRVHFAQLLVAGHTANSESGIGFMSLFCRFRRRNLSLWYSLTVWVWEFVRVLTVFYFLSLVFGTLGAFLGWARSMDGLLLRRGFSG